MTHNNKTKQVCQLILGQRYLLEVVVTTQCVASTLIIFLSRIVVRLANSEHKHFTRNSSSRSLPYGAKCHLAHRSAPPVAVSGMQSTAGCTSNSGNKKQLLITVHHRLKCVVTRFTTVYINMLITCTKTFS